MKSFRELINKQQPELSQPKAATTSFKALATTTAPSPSPIKRLETTTVTQASAKVPTAVANSSAAAQVSAAQVSAAQVVAKPKERYAFATIHFGSNPVYLELELYFFKMLRQNTSHDILYLYSVNDTPPAFVEAVRPLVTDVIPYDDKPITLDVTFNI